MGISGMGVSALALLLKKKGFRVSGSDREFYGPGYGILKKEGIKIFRNYSRKNIPPDADLVVVGGKHANFEPEKNEEVKFALRAGMKMRSVPEILGELARRTENTVVAGSFGKSTVTALLAWCLKVAKKNPSYFIGAVPLEFSRHAELEKGKHFILEGDEYPSSNWDDRSKFLHLRPRNVILISAEHDHMNVFPKEADYLKPYKKLIALLPRNGLLVTASEGKNIKKVVAGAKCKVVSYGLTKKSMWHPENISYGERTAFDLFRGRQKIVRLETELLGNHNIENIVGASAFLLEKKLISPKQLRSGVKTFRGLTRRLDLKTRKSSVPVYEGFGSSYPKAKSVFDALELHYPDKRLITVFEPHTASWSHKRAKDWYRDIFRTSDQVIFLPPPAYRRNEPGQLTQGELVKFIRKYRKRVHPVKTEKEALSFLKKITKKDDIIVLVSSGSLLGLARSVPRLMEKLFPK